MLTKQEEEEVVVWCKNMNQLIHDMDLIQMKSIVFQIYQGRTNPFKDIFPGKSWWAGYKLRHPDLMLQTT